MKTLKEIVRIKKTKFGLDLHIPFSQMTKEIKNMETSEIIYKLFPQDTSFGVVTTKRTKSEFVIICHYH